MKIKEKEAENGLVSKEYKNILQQNEAMSD